MMTSQLVRTVSRSDPLTVFPFQGVWIAIVGSFLQGGISEVGNSPAEAIAKMATHFVVIPGGPILCCASPIDTEVP